jgi:hypothetical protein
MPLILYLFAAASAALFAGPAESAFAAPLVVENPAGKERSPIVPVRGGAHTSGGSSHGTTASGSGGRTGGSHFRGGNGGRNFRSGRGSNRGRNVSRSRFQRLRHLSTRRHARNFSRPRRLKGHFHKTPPLASRKLASKTPSKRVFRDQSISAGATHIAGGAGTQALATSPVAQGSGADFNQDAQVAHMQVGSVVESVYNGRKLTHKVVGNRHKALVGHRFRRPGGHLHRRLAALKQHRWHRRFKHVVIVGADGAPACNDFCDFRVPVAVYGEFVAAVDEALAEEAEAAAYAEEESAAPEQRRRNKANATGWNKAVVILEDSAQADETKEGDTKVNAGAVEAVIDRPDEQVDVVIDDIKEAKR